MQRRNFVRVVGSAAACAAVGASWSQPGSGDFPNRPIKILVGSPAGGPLDVLMRQLAENVSKIVGQMVIVENRAGAGGALPAYALQSSAPDGYTVAHISNSVFRLPHTTNLSWDPVRDIQYMMGLVGFTFGFVVPANSPFKNWADFVAYAKANPGRLSYGSVQFQIPHLAAETIAQNLGIKLQFIPYKGNADMTQALMGNVIMAAADSTGFVPFVESGKLRLLNSWGPARMTRFPDVPTLKDLGIDMVVISHTGLGLPRDTPPAIAKRLHDAFKKGMEEPSFAQALARYEAIPMYMSAEGYTAFAKESVAKEKVTIEKLGLGKTN